MRGSTQVTHSLEVRVGPLARDRISLLCWWWRRRTALNWRVRWLVARNDEVVQLDGADERDHDCRALALSRRQQFI